MSLSAIGSRSLDIINKAWGAVINRIDKLIQSKTNVDPISLTTQNKIIHLLRNSIIDEAEFDALTSLMHAWRVANLYKDSIPVTVDKAYEFSAIATANNQILWSKMSASTQGQREFERMLPKTGGPLYNNTLSAVDDASGPTTAFAHR